MNLHNAVLDSKKVLDDILSDGVYLDTEDRLSANIDWLLQVLDDEELSTEDLSSVHTTVADATTRLEEVRQSGIERPEIVEPVIEPTIEELRATARATMLAWVNSFLQPFTEKVSGPEPIVWVKKEQAARAYQAETADATQTMMIEVEAEVTGETPMELCTLVISMADNYTAIIAFTTGLRRATSAAIELANTPAELAQVLENAKATAVAKAAELM